MSGDDAFYDLPKDDYGGTLDFNGYQSKTNDPGEVLFILTTFSVILLIAILMPCMVITRKIERATQSTLNKGKLLNRPSDTPKADDSNRVNVETTGNRDEYVQLDDQHTSPIQAVLAITTPCRILWGNELQKIRSSIMAVVRLDKESRSILRFAGPFTFYAIASALLCNVLLALISWYIGTKEVAAYAVVGILIALSEEFLKGPMYANTTMIAQAVGANNNFLAGQYVQLSLWMYLIVGAPFLAFWYCFTYRIILALTSGDQTVADLGQDFVKIYIWSYVTDSIHQAIGQLLDVTGHEIFTTFIDFSKSTTNVIILLYWIKSNIDINLNTIAWMYFGTSTFYLAVSILASLSMGWLKPFIKGMTLSPAIMNGIAVTTMLKTAIPLAFGSVVSNAEWAVLTIMAGYLGPAEVSAWAILGTIWSFFVSLTKGIGVAAECRIAYHLGNNHPALAKLSAYKSLFLGTLGSAVVSIIFLFHMHRIPAWFTPDSTLQAMIGSTLPYIGVGNIVLTVGRLCWYVVGAQGRYKLGTLVNFFADWFVTIPLAGTFTFAWNFDLQGLTSAVVLGYVALGAALFHVLLASDWDARAVKIQKRNIAVVVASEKKIDPVSPDDKEDADEEVFAALAGGRARAARATAKRKIRLLTAPPGRLGIQIGTLAHRTGVVVTNVLFTSPFFGRVFVGDIILSVDGYEVTKNSPASAVHEIMMLRQDNDRELTILTNSGHCHNEDSQDVLLTGEIPDIPDFESFDLNGQLH